MCDVDEGEAKSQAFNLEKSRGSIQYLNDHQDMMMRTVLSENDNEISFQEESQVLEKEGENNN